MTDLTIKLRCTACEGFRDFDRERGSRVVRCADCGKRHSTDSLHAVEPTDLPEEDSGTTGG